MFKIKTKNCRVTVQIQSYGKIGLNLYKKGQALPDYVTVDSPEMAVSVINTFVTETDTELQLILALERAGYVIHKI